MHELDFNALLSPLSAEHFLAEYWESKPMLLKRADNAYYDSLLKLTDLEHHVSRAGTRYPDIRLAKGGAFFPPEAYTYDVKYGDEVFRGLCDLEKLVTEYSNGATLTLPALHLGSTPLGRLCRQLEAELDHAVHANAYLTAANADGFTPHYDTHEVFALQIAGVKHWRIYPPAMDLPHRSQPFCPDRYALPSAPLMQFDLAAGDLLYLPRGYVHTTATTECFSAHVTLGISVYTWIDLLSELLQGGVELPELRRALPPGFAHRQELGCELSQRLTGLLDRLGATLDAAAVRERFFEKVRSARTRGATEFRADASVIGPDTPLRVAATDCRLSRERDGLVLQLHGRRVRLQTAVSPILEAMCRATPFTLRSLPADVSLEARLALGRYLHGLGFLRPLDETG